jgi:hypothetical protein
MDTQLLQFKHPGPAPTIDEVCKLFGLKSEEIDREFGVIATDPKEGLYTVLIDAKATQQVESVIEKRPRHPAEGIFANPKIEPFGPPEK